MDCTVVTCVTGNFNKLHKTNLENGVVFSTISDKDFIVHTKAQGWRFEKLPFNHTDDLREASRQSKYVKFFKYFNPPTKYAIYVDHKYIINQEHIGPLINALGDNAFLSFKNNKTIYEELFDSLLYPRYRNDLDRIITTISDHNKYELQNLELFLTGLIVYNTQHPSFVGIKQKIEQYIEKYQHLQCQILFSLALKDERKTLVDNTFGIIHKLPQEHIFGKTY